MLICKKRLSSAQSAEQIAILAAHVLSAVRLLPLCKLLCSVCQDATIKVLILPHALAFFAVEKCYYNSGNIISKFIKFYI